MSTTTMPINIRTFRATETGSGGRTAETAAIDPFHETRYHFARFTALSVAAFVVMSALTVLTA